MDANERLLRSAEELLQNREDPRAKQALVEAHAADVAQVLQHLPPPDRATIFRSLAAEQAGDVLSELDDATLLSLVRSLDDMEVSQILDRMPAEHAADVVDELSTEHAEKILDLMEEERSEEIQEILEYPEDSAGRLMSTDVVAVRETSTVEEAIQHIRKTVTEERPFGVYAIDDHQHLIGRVPLRRLLTADPRSLILGILDDEAVVSVNAKMDREEVARVVAKYDLVTVPVVDDQNRLVGIISVDDVIDVVEEEASEDIFRIAGSDAAELERRSPGQVAMLRLPWVLLTLLIEMLAGVVIHYFDRTLGKVILLASFMPVIQAISGNTGLQSVTMVVRGLATGQVQLSRWWEPLWRQIQTSAILGAVCAVVVGLLGLLWHSRAFGFVVATSMFISVNLSGCAGTAIPMLSKRMGFDPALTAGPFETAFQDVLGVTIFLSLATAMLYWLV